MTLHANLGQSLSSGLSFLFKAKTDKGFRCFSNMVVAILISGFAVFTWTPVLAQSANQKNKTKVSQISPIPAPSGAPSKVDSVPPPEVVPVDPTNPPATPSPLNSTPATPATPANPAPVNPPTVEPVTDANPAPVTPAAASPATSPLAPATAVDVPDATAQMEDAAKKSEFFAEFRTLGLSFNLGSFKYKPVGGSSFNGKSFKVDFGYLPNPIVVQLKSGFRLGLTPIGRLFAISLQRGKVFGAWEFGGEIREAAMGQSSEDQASNRTDKVKNRTFKFGGYVRSYPNPFKIPAEYYLGIGIDSRYNFAAQGTARQITSDAIGTYLAAGANLFFPVKASPNLNYVVGIDGELSYMNHSKFLLLNSITSKKGTEFKLNFSFAGLRASF